MENHLGGPTRIKLLLELNENTLSAAVDSFIQHKINELARKKKYSPKIRDAVQHHLTSKANGTFLWVALVCKELAKVSKWDVQRKLENFPPGLDELYGRMLSQLSKSYDADLCLFSALPRPFSALSRWKSYPLVSTYLKTPKTIYRRL